MINDIDLNYDARVITNDQVLMFGTIVKYGNFKAASQITKRLWDLLRAKVEY